jgi:hypothetical protein
MEILDAIAVDVELEQIKTVLHLRGATADQKAAALWDKARPQIHARAVYRACHVDARLDDAVTLDGVTIQSKVMRKNLDTVDQVYAYVVTIGAELENLAPPDDPVEKFYLDAIGNLAVRAARKFMERHLRDQFHVGRMAHMNPGSLGDWPLEQQDILFGMLGDVQVAIGVHLTPSRLMLPKKSVSGIAFPTEGTYLNCMICPKLECSGRQAPYDEHMALEYGVAH